MFNWIVHVDHHQNFNFVINFKKLFRNTFFFFFLFPNLNINLHSFFSTSLFFLLLCGRQEGLQLTYLSERQNVQTNPKQLPECRSIPQHSLPLLPLFWVLVIAFSFPKSNFIANSFFSFSQGSKRFSYIYIGFHIVHLYYL